MFAGPLKVWHVVLLGLLAGSVESVAGIFSCWALSKRLGARVSCTRLGRVCVFKCVSFSPGCLCP